MEDGFLERFAAKESAKRGEVAKEQQSQLRRHAVRVACTSCERFDHGPGAWWEDEVGKDLDDKSRGHLLCERQFEFSPVAHRDLWPGVNLNYCRAWVRRWSELAAALRSLDEIESGVVLRIRGTAIDDYRHATMHELFVALLDGEEEERVVERLVAVRDAMVPSDAEIARAGGWAPRSRFELSGYFRRLLDMAQNASPAPARQPSPDHRVTFDSTTATPAPPDASVPNQVINQPQSRIATSPDFTWVRVGDETFSFAKGQQANCIMALYKAWIESGKRDGHGMCEETLGDTAGSGSSTFRVQKLFQGHPALNRVLASPSKGVWALYLNEPR